MERRCCRIGVRGDFRDRELRRIKAFQGQGGGEQFPGRIAVRAIGNGQQANIHSPIMAPYSIQADTQASNGPCFPGKQREAGPCG